MITKLIKSPGRVLSTLLVTPLAVVLWLARVKFVHSGQLFHRIGHLSLELDLLLKSQLVGWRSRFRGIIVAPSGKAVNPSLLRSWGKHFKLITNPALSFALRPLARHPLVSCNSSMIEVPSLGRMAFMPAGYPLQTKYQREFGDHPLLTLTSPEVERGWNELEKLGISRGSWFVGLHVREGGYLPDLTYHSYRDADIATYLPATATVVKRGGSVIRMGDTTMQRLPETERIKDYVHSPIHSDWMDIFCFSQARFVIGTSSGAFDAACAFGVPGALTNWAPMGHGPYTQRDIWIPKLYWSIAEERYLTFEEVLTTPMRGFDRTEQYEEAGVRLIDNSPEEISDLVSEMLGRLDGGITYTAEDEELQSRFKTLLAANPMYATTARVGRAFLQKYASLLEDVIPERSNTEWVL